jgi:hypothetical protein
MSLFNKFIPNKKHIINLDLPPSERWLELLYIYRYEFHDVIPIFKELLQSMFGVLLTPASLIIGTRKLLGGILYEEELQSIANFLHISFEEILLLQLCYELNSCCTSLVTNVQNKKTFFRTMDWPLDFLNKLTVDLEFQKNGKTIFIATSWVGYVGIATATVPNKYSVSMNFRLTKDRTITNILSNVYALFNMKWPVGYLIREVCSSECSYRKMLIDFSKASLVSPCYLTICPANSDSPFIITRDPDSFEIYENDYVVQTNCDCDKIEPDVLYSLDRRNLANSIISQNNNNFVSTEQLLKKMLVTPIVNEETIYYTIMNPVDGVHFSATYFPKTMVR